MMEIVYVPRGEDAPAPDPDGGSGGPGRPNPDPDGGSGGPGGG